MSKWFIYLKSNFICGLAYLITRHKKEYIFLNRNFSRLLLKFYRSDEESVSSDSSNNHCNSLEYTYQLFVAFLINSAKKLMWILLKAYKAAPSKTFWLSQWNRDYPNFQLDMNKAKRWENDYAKKEKTEKQMKEDTESFLQA